MIGSQPVFFGKVTGVATADLDYDITLSSADTHTLPLKAGTYNFTVDWGDGSPVDTVTTTSASHAYAGAGTYNIKIDGQCERFQFNFGGDRGQVSKINAIKSPNLGMTNASDMWEGCFAITSASGVDFTGVTNVSYAFSNCTMTSISSTSPMVTSSTTNATSMFAGCSNLISPPDTSGWDTSGLTSLLWIFKDCIAMTSPPDTSGWDTSGVTNAGGIFFNCSSMTSPPDTSGWDTSNMTSMVGMFQGCSSMTTPPDTSVWGLTSCTVNKLFEGCSSMTSPPDTSGWALAASNKSGESMFEGCSSMTTPPDTSGWTLNGYLNFSRAFYNCNSLTSAPDTTNWNTLSMENWELAFAGCPASIKPDLTNLEWNNAENLVNMFTVDGGNGPTYTNAEIDAWLIKLETDQGAFTPAGLTFDYSTLTGNVHLDSGRSTAATTAINDLITNGATRVGTY